MVTSTMRQSPGPILRNCGKQPGQDRSRNRGKRNPLLPHETSVGQILPIGSRTTPVMDEMIRGLDDTQTFRVLTTVARVRLRAGGVAETANKEDILNCRGKMPSLRRGGLPGS